MITVIPAPQVNPNDDRLEVVAWHVENGARIEAGQEIADVETTKAVVTLSAETAGFVERLVERHEVVRVGAPLYRLASALEELRTATETSVTESSSIVAAPAITGNPARATAPPLLDHAYPATRFSKRAAHMLEERKVSPEAFQGAGLMTVKRLRALLGLEEDARVHAEPAIFSSARDAPAPAAGGGPSRHLPVRHERVSLAKEAEIAALSAGESGNINSLLAVRFESASIRERLLRERQFDGNPQPIILFEISRLLTQWPQFTAFYGDHSVHFHDRIDLGLAVDLGRGLKVVTIAGADRLMPMDFFERTLDIGARYLDNRLRPEELEGSTLTITDLSGYDILEFHPLINGNQSAIIGVGGDKSLPGHPMSITMVFDHRVSSGREVAVFLNEVRNRLLSYARPMTPSSSVEGERPASATNIVHGTSLSVTKCDRCGIETAAYYEAFRQDAYLLTYVRADGSVGGVCHRCFGRWN